MEERKRELQKIYSQWSTEKLKHAVENERDQYEAIAIEAMAEELKSRGESVTTAAVSAAPPAAPASTSLKANKKIADEQVCSLCNGKFLIGDMLEKCEKCGSYYHQRCWNENNGCIKPGCRADTKTCPMCGETIKATALKCRYCGEYLDKSLKEEKTQLGVLKEAKDSLTYAIVGIFCFGIILGPVAVFKGIKALNMIQEEPRYEGKGKATAGIIIGGIVTLLYIVGILVRLSEM
ncbi:MAG: DUF4190 domain-containing protein [Candidatus Aminicenantes bacterium]|nr:MAG: DUF4190 domain-containing protein [Candidatus Aminicenantes bacterium]